MDEHDIVGGVLTRDSDAEEAFVHALEPRIRRAVYEAGVRSADTDDLVQDILIEALRQLATGRFQERSSLRTWVRKITHGRIVDYWRTAGRRGLDKAVSLETVDHLAADFLTEASQEILLLTEEALASMPPRHQLAIRAHCQGKMSIEELARLFGLSVERTRGILTEAKQMFRQAVCGSDKKPIRRRL